jgi:hypothetical protein
MKISAILISSALAIASLQSAVAAPANEQRCLLGLCLGKESSRHEHSEHEHSEHEHSEHEPSRHGSWRHGSWGHHGDERHHNHHHDRAGMLFFILSFRLVADFNSMIAPDNVEAQPPVDPQEKGPWEHNSWKHESPNHDSWKHESPNHESSKHDSADSWNESSENDSWKHGPHHHHKQHHDRSGTRHFYSFISIRN